MIEKLRDSETLTRFVGKYKRKMNISEYHNIYLFVVFNIVISKIQSEFHTLKSAHNTS